MSAFFRFVNTVINSKLERKVVWNHIKTLRFKFLQKNINLVCENDLIPTEHIKHTFHKFSHIVGFNANNNQTKSNVSRGTLEMGGKMFIALYSCPSFYERLYWKAIYKRNEDIAMIASKIVEKVKSDYKIVALKVFSKVCSVLGFKHISYQHVGNNRSNIELKKNIADVKGDIK